MPAARRQCSSTSARASAVSRMPARATAARRRCSPTPARAPAQLALPFARWQQQLEEETAACASCEDGECKQPIAPADLEAVLVQHPEVVDVAVTSAEDEEAGEIPVAFVVRRSGSHLTCVQVMEYVAKQVSPYKKVRKVIFVEAIPKSAAGKVLRRLLKDSLRLDAAASSSDHTKPSSRL